MSHDNFLNTALQYGKERNFSGLSQFALDQLRTRRKQTLPQITHLISHTNDAIRDALFSALIQDGGADTLFLLMQIFQTSHDPTHTERRLLQLSQHENPEVLDLVDALEPILPPGLKRSFHKAQSVVRARFRSRFLLRSFASAEGKQLSDLANTMIRSPHVDFLALFEQMPSQLTHCREALRVLRSMPQPGALRLIMPTLMRFLEREQVLARFASLPLPVSSEILTPQKLLNGMVEHQDHPLTKQALEKLMVSCRNDPERIDPGQLIAPYGLKGSTQVKARQLVAQVLASGENAPSAAQFKAELVRWQEDDSEMLCLFLFSAAQMAVKLKDASFADELLAKIRHDETRRARLQIWIFAGLADGDSVQKLLHLLGQNPGEILTRELLRALAEVPLDHIPDAVMLLALDGNRHVLRLAALDFLARSSQGQGHLEHLLANAPLVIKEDVSATIVRHQLKACVPALMGLLNGRITDSFRLIILATLEHFESEDIGRPICAFLMAGQTLPVRLAALQTLMRAGGPQRLDMILDTISGDEGKRHRAELASAFLAELADKDPLFFEDKLLLQRKFLEELLHFPTPTLRLQTLDLMERMSWETEAREGWVGLLQRVLQTLVGQRQPEEVERLRKLIDALSSRFDSERKKQVLHRRVITISNGLDHQLRLERIQALRQLDWIFSPEMVSGDPQGVKRLALRIERMLEQDAGDTPIEVLAIEVAGKVGHPTLHKKIKEYLNHSEAEVVSAARRALKRPVNSILLENLIKTVFHIDDSGYITRLAGSILTQEGYTAVAATDPERAVELLRKDDYDLLLLDLNMPRMRGYDFLCMIRRMGIAPRYTFVLTSVRTHEDLVEVFKEGVDGVLLKPFQAEELVQKIREIRERAI